MEIPAWLFFSFWALTSITFLHLGFYALDETELSNSVSPLLMFLFKHSLAISSCSSSNYALVFRPQWKYVGVDRRYFWALFAGLLGLCYNPLNTVNAFSLDFCVDLWWLNLMKFSVWLLNVALWLLILIDISAWLRGGCLKNFTGGFLTNCVFVHVLCLTSDCIRWYFIIFPLLNFYIIRGTNRVAREVQTRIGIHMAVETSLCFVSGDFFPFLVMYVSFFVSGYWAALSEFEPCTSVSWLAVAEKVKETFLMFKKQKLEDESFKELLPVAEKVKETFLMFKKKKLGKLVRYGIGMMGTALFQYFFRLTSFKHVVAFLYLAVMWVANLTMLGVSSDLGIFNFVLGNVVFGSTVSQFGLRGTTWFAYGACLVLYGLRLKLQSLTLKYGEGEHIRVTLWSQTE